MVIIYATNSGSTYLVSKRLESLLKKKHTVRVVEAKNAIINDIANADLVIFGSPSWNFDGREGLPHQAMLACMERVKAYQFNGKACAIFGSGDTSYTYFCGAVDHLEHFVHEQGGTLLIPSLRIDGYYFDEKKAIAQVEEWAKNFLAIKRGIETE